MNAKMKEKQDKYSDTAMDAIAMLTADHKKVRGLFDELEKIKSKKTSSEKKNDLVLQICQELAIHTQLEEEIFYPAVREAIEDEDLMDEAEVEHACAKELIAQLEEMDAQDDLYDAKVTVLGEQIVHHVKEEEGDMFVKAKKSKVDTGELGAQMARRKKELLGALDNPMDVDSGKQDEGEEDDDESDSQKRKSTKRVS